MQILSNEVSGSDLVRAVKYYVNVVHEITSLLRFSKILKVH